LPGGVHNFQTGLQDVKRHVLQQNNKCCFDKGRRGRLNPSERNNDLLLRYARLECPDTSPLPSLVLHFPHQRLERAPADLAQISIDVRHELFAIAGPVYVDMRPPQIAVRFPKAAIADKGRFGCHNYVKAPAELVCKRKPTPL
jgi:hypothetical protein